MKGYAYHPLTKEYIGEIDVPIQFDTRDYLFPADSTETTPLTHKEGYLIKYIDENWVYEKILSIEEKKIQGLLPLQDGEIIKNMELIVVPKPDKYHIWKDLSWVCDSSIRKDEIIKELENTDTLTIRPLRAVMSGLGTESDKERLAELETKARELREELKNLVVE